MQGSRDWADYAVEADLMLHLGAYGGVILRAEGQRRFYAARVTSDGRFQIVRRKDETETVLAETSLDMPFETAFSMTVSAVQDRMEARIGDTVITASDASFPGGAAGLVVYEGALSATRIRVRPV
ncbi:hypothetical protein [Rhizobium sp. G21]|uniref:hypothetical protein n=1 Tax=Rhizobium sp. G21 TaxID=2758439 RepID=UPI001FED62FD|nr:hypothetical protein [Rhizobium sp. G21]